MALLACSGAGLAASAVGDSAANSAAQRGRIEESVRVGALETAARFIAERTPRNRDRASDGAARAAAIQRIARLAGRAGRG